MEADISAMNKDYVTRSEEILREGGNKFRAVAMQGIRAYTLPRNNIERGY